MTKEELLNNPLVKNISKEFLSTFLLSNSEISIDQLWDEYLKSKLPKKEWEITGMREKKGFFDYSTTEWYATPGHHFSVNDLKDNKLILSLKRLSDGVEFRIGDKVKTDFHKNSDIPIQPFKIKEFIPYADKMFISFIVSESVVNGGVNPQNDTCCISNLQLVNTIPFFQTEDGVDVFEGDEYWSVLTNSIDFELIKDKADYNWAMDDRYHKTFSTKEKAEEYVLNNKPCLSLKDVINASGNTPLFNEHMKEIVKSKLK